MRKAGHLEAIALDKEAADDERMAALLAVALRSAEAGRALAAKMPARLTIPPWPINVPEDVRHTILQTFAGRFDAGTDPRYPLAAAMLDRTAPHIDSPLEDWDAYEERCDAEADRFIASVAKDMNTPLDSMHVADAMAQGRGTYKLVYRAGSPHGPYLFAVSLWGRFYGASWHAETDVTSILPALRNVGEREGYRYIVPELANTQLPGLETLTFEVPRDTEIPVGSLVFWWYD